MSRPWEAGFFIEENAMNLSRCDDVMTCDGACGRELGPDEEVVEVTRDQVYCRQCALVTTVSDLLSMEAAAQIRAEQLALV